MLQAERRKSRVIEDVNREYDSLVLSSDYGFLRLTPKNNNIIKVTFSTQKQVSSNTYVGILDAPDDTIWSYSESEDMIAISTKSLVLNISRKTGSIKTYDAEGRLLLAERSYESRILDEYMTYKVVDDGSAETENLSTPDGIKRQIKSAKKRADKLLFRTRVHLDLHNDEKLFGLGQSPEGVFHIRGTTQYIHQANMKIAIPFLVSTNGYGLLFATGSPAVFHDSDYGTYFQTEADKHMEYYIIAGGTYNEIIKGYRFLTGKATMLPKWVFGYIQSQERYETSEELITTASEYRNRGIGLDCIVLDWHSWEGEQWGQKTFDPKRFPNPTQLLDELHAKNVRMMISIWPSMHKTSRDHAEFKEQGLLLPYSELYDAFNKTARKLYWQQAMNGLFLHGVDAWWCDNCEPFTPEWTKIEEPEPSALYHDYIREAGEFVPLELGNVYGLLHAKGIFEGQRGVCDEKRVVNLIRSGYVGQQKYGVILWSGDTSASWETLRKQIIAGLQLCACGLPYWTLDIGAFFVKCGKPWFWNGNYEEGIADLGYRELYVRWFQYGAFLPIFRAHGTDIRREVWAFGEPGEMFYDALCSAIELRYKLMPYIYSLAGAAWYDDATIIRFLTFEFPDDRETAKISDQYMFGPSLMVCPVTTPMLYKEGSIPIKNISFTRKVYLPDGCNWYDYWTNRKYEGGRWINADADIGRIPLFVREGSIIPMTDAMGYVDENPDAPITLRIYPGSDGEFVLYEDDGDGYAYENGVYKLTRFSWDNESNTLSNEVIHSHAALEVGAVEFIKNICIETQK